MADPKQQSNHSLSVSHLLMHSSVVILFALAILIYPAASTGPQFDLLPNNLESCRAHKVAIINEYLSALVKGDRSLVNKDALACVGLMKRKKLWFRAEAWGKIGAEDVRWKREVLMDLFKTRETQRKLEADDKDLAWVAATFLFLHGVANNELEPVEQTKEIVLRALDKRLEPWINSLDKALEISRSGNPVEKVKTAMKDLSPILWALQKEKAPLSKSTLMFYALNLSFHHFFSRDVQAAIQWEEPPPMWRRALKAVWDGAADFLDYDGVDRE